MMSLVSAGRGLKNCLWKVRTRQFLDFEQHLWILTLKYYKTEENLEKMSLGFVGMNHLTYLVENVKT